MRAEDAYLAQLRATLHRVVERLVSKGISEHHLRFGGQGEAPARRPTVPTDARSEFLANRAMGDWAEKVLSSALGRALPELKVVQYGRTDRIAAGHPDFKVRYLAGLEETRLFGKRPDLLLFRATEPVTGDLSGHSHVDTEALARRAVAAVEVRSSKFEALTYMSVRRRQQEGRQQGRPGNAKLHRQGRGPGHCLSMARAAWGAANLLPGLLRFRVCHQLPGHLLDHCRWNRI